MSTTYTTIQGDTWDVIAKRVLGSTSYTGYLLMANLRKVDYLFFPAGVELVIPDVDKTIPSAPVPWKGARGA